MKLKRNSVLLIIFIFILFFARSGIFLDPDFGFRLKTGELILNKGIPNNDPYSFTMPSFPYVEHAWITAVAWTKLYPVIGKIGLSLSYSFMSLLALIISYSRTKRTKVVSRFQPFTFILAAAVLLPFVGVRAQIATWLFTAILLKVLFDEKLWQKWKKATPLLFIFWANIHGGFFAGLFILFFVVLARVLRTKILEKLDLLIIFVTAFATLINPYGLGVWREIWLSLSDTTLRWQIAEWMPAFVAVDLPLAAFIALSVVLLIRYRHKFEIEEIGLFFLILIQAVFSRRHVPLWLITVLPMVAYAINLFYQEIKGIKKGPARFEKAMKFAFLGSLVILMYQFFISQRGAIDLSEERFYPKSAVSYLSSNLPDGEVFSEYGWGGYLIWRLPEKKVFIDGRMPSWRGSANPPSESSNAFKDYNSLLKGELDYKQVFAKFGVDTVLWPQPKSKTTFENWSAKIESLFPKKEKEMPDFNLLNALEEDNWEKVYEDEVAVIYQSS